MPELEEPHKAGTRFPFINLQKALERTKQLFDADQKGREIAITAAFEVWGYSEKSSGGFQTIGALKMYGLLKDSGGGDSRKIALTAEALHYFKDERPEEHMRLRQYFALRPRLIQALWGQWHASPPADTIARSYLKTEVGLNDQSARSVLSIYKENIAFADFKPSDKVPEPAAEPESDSPGAIVEKPKGNLSFLKAAAAGNIRKVDLMEGERELTTGLLSKESNFRLIVSGKVGVKEIERLIAKLELDKEILAEMDDPAIE